MADNIQALREILFASIRDLKANRMDAEQAKAISDLSSRVIDSTRVEIDFLRLVGGGENTGFFERVAERPAIEQAKPKLEAVSSGPRGAL